MFKKPKRPSAVKRLLFSIPRARNIAREINSAQTRVAFVSNLAVAHYQGNLDKVVLTMLRLQIRASRLPKKEKMARIAILKDYRKMIRP